MGAVDNAAKLRTIALAAIERQCFGEDFGFDCAPLIGQSPTGSVMVLYALVVTKKNPLLGQAPLVHVVHLPSLDPTPEQVERAVTEAMTGLRDLSTKILNDGDTAAVHAR